MAVDVKDKGALGCAYYRTSEDAIYLLRDAPGTGLLTFINFLMVHVEPTVVVLPLKMPDEVVRFFEEHKVVAREGRFLRGDTAEQRSMHGLDDPGTERYLLRTVGSNEFNHQDSIDKLIDLPPICSGPIVVNTATGRSPNDVAQGECRNIKLMRLGSFVDLDCFSSIGCAGAVLGEIARIGNAADGLLRVPVASIQMFALSDSMLVTDETISSLQVFQSELHPNRLMSGSATAGSCSKESLSVYGLFHPFASTPQGKVKLRQMFLRPSLNLDTIRERQKTVTVLLQSDNAEALESVCGALKKIQDVRRPLEQLRRGADIPTGKAIGRGVWWSLTRFSIAVLQLQDAMLQLQHTHGLAGVQQVLSIISARVIKGVAEKVDSIIDFDEVKASSRIAVKPHVNVQLDKLKHDYQGLDSLLDDICKSMSQELPEWARPYVTGCVFWPQLGFFTVVSLRQDGTPAYMGQELYDDRWEVMFITGGSVYFKNRRMAELDAQLGDPYSGIVDLEIQILHDLACEVLEHAPVLNHAADACGDFDCLVALARGARKYGWTAPTMTTDNVISIQGGRHPLQELAVHSFIANDCMLEGGCGDPRSHHGETTTLVITGPNHSGKSVCIKQVALIVYLAHIGSFVPASLATIGITDQILTRISTRESVSQKESAFGTDLRQGAFVMRHATRRSLVVIDEFGKGTPADDGAGLMAGLIDHFTALGTDAPKVLITTHCHEIFEGGYLRDRPGLTFAYMDVRLDLAAPIDDQVVFLYDLRLGRSISSFGSNCAAINGVSKAVVERAEAIILLLARNEDLGAACAKLDDEDQARLQEAEAVARNFIELAMGDEVEAPREILGHLLWRG
ncbi:DNA mismatch repair protein MSH5 [Colletotrichum fructicola Nara gc5]|uniref:DNA mismatch repair protein MSH5 n=1 Tax=Colletotrichum fructicola (strain Nara gc5) TaxID=1213859 RepID=A0A7J6IN05_COLFN|nr:DNA mismatch repair protein MSH5 [Colletotrichum fructicola]KAF4477601.1 DNA mismatch repair protein MSH5 [Colletotrichum fructicola Nara gc5]KAF5493884.1 DNA mismatch repair protein MSH5 [Colletotrichum fructicola]